MVKPVDERVEVSSLAFQEVSLKNLYARTQQTTPRRNYVRGELTATWGTLGGEARQN